MIGFLIPLLIHCGVMIALEIFVVPAIAQSAYWQQSVWHEPQVRYLLADMTLGGNVQLYRDYASKERDRDSREAIRLLGQQGASSEHERVRAQVGDEPVRKGWAGDAHRSRLRKAVSALRSATALHILDLCKTGLSAFFPWCSS